MPSRIRAVLSGQRDNKNRKLFKLQMSDTELHCQSSEKGKRKHYGPEDSEKPLWRVQYAKWRKGREEWCIWDNGGKIRTAEGREDDVNKASRSKVKAWDRICVFREISDEYCICISEKLIFKRCDLFRKSAWWTEEIRGWLIGQTQGQSLASLQIKYISMSLSLNLSKTHFFICKNGNKDASPAR